MFMFTTALEVKKWHSPGHGGETQNNISNSLSWTSLAYTCTVHVVEDTESDLSK